MESHPTARHLPPVRLPGDPPLRQYGAVEVLLGGQQLVGALTCSLAVLAADLGLVTEHSFGRDNECDLAYMQTQDDGFTLVQWSGSPDVEVHAFAKGVGSDFRERDELRRLLQATAIPATELRFPSDLP